MRIFLFLLLSLSILSCTTVEVTKEVIKVTNTITDKVKERIPKKEIAEEDALDEILEDLEEKEIEEEIKIIEETQEEEKNIVASQQKLAEINFIGKTENQILNLLGEPKLSRIDGAVHTTRYNSDNCRLFFFFNQNIENKRVEYFELRNDRADLLNSKQSLEQCYREFNLIN
mgnify:CR=1 FL=1|tara:strand:- start:876 stop:1391 length:516 start_codon:yes stop_codon:yes gene_type:complete